MVAVQGCSHRMLAWPADQCNRRAGWLMINLYIFGVVLSQQRSDEDEVDVRFKPSAFLTCSGGAEIKNIAGCIDDVSSRLRLGHANEARLQGLELESLTSPRMRIRLPVGAGSGII